jgi:hypothetical protein
MTIHNEFLEQCCGMELCVELPACSVPCFELQGERIYWNLEGGLVFEGVLTNRASFPIGHVDLNPPAGITVSPDPQFLLPPLLPGQSTPISFTIFGDLPFTSLCLPLTVCDEAMIRCCEGELCIENIPFCFIIWDVFPLYALGQAALFPTPEDFLVVDQIGSEGDDGFRVELDHVRAVDLTWIELDPFGFYPDGLYIQAQARGRFDSIDDFPLGTLRVTDVGDDYEVSADFSEIGAASIFAQVYLRETLLAEYPMLAGPLVARLSALPVQIGHQVESGIPGLDTTGFGLGLARQGEITVAGETYDADRLVVLAESPAGLAESISEFSMTAADLPQIVLIDITTVDGDSGVCATPGDMDSDGDFDLADMSQFMRCFGADATADFACSCANVDASDDMINLADWAAFEALIDGPQ